jgi:hypothetical protein
MQRAQAGGKPSKGTPADKRLKENRPAPAPMKGPMPMQPPKGPMPMKGK